MPRTICHMAKSVNGSLPYGSGPIFATWQIQHMYGSALKSLRADRGLTLEHVAERVGVSVSQIQRFENEVREPRYRELAALADVYGVPVASLFGESASPVEVKMVPRLSLVAAGDWWVPDPILRTDDLETVPVPGLGPGDWAAIEVTGSSMDRISPPGSVIIVNRAEKTLVPNACYVIADEQGRTTYKRYRPSPDRFEPVTFTDGYETIFPNGRVEVIGRVRRSMINM